LRMWGVFFRKFYCFAKHFCELAPTFAENVVFLQVGPQEAASGRSYGLGT
jgi:hypothetical protein